MISGLSETAFYTLVPFISPINTILPQLHQLLLLSLEHSGSFFFCTFSVFYIFFPLCFALHMKFHYNLKEKRERDIPLSTLPYWESGKFHRTYSKATFPSNSIFTQTSDHLYRQLILISRRIALLNIATARA